MALPKKIKKTLPLSNQKYFLSRREELLNNINRDGTFLPKSVLHADLDKGMLDFVKNELKLNVSGKIVPTIDVIVTTQNWTQFTQTWDFQNLDKNVSVPFITTVRQPEVKFGTNPATQYTIPNRKQFYYAKVPTWDGQRKGMDIYKIPQPVPVDITYNVKIFCNRMRELNQFNKLILQQFSSRQSYTVVKGHYIPIILDSINDESVMEMEKRKYYVQNYTFTMLGFLIDEDEFEISPAISRTLVLSEVETRTKRKKIVEFPENPDTTKLLFDFTEDEFIKEKIFSYGNDLVVNQTINIDSYEIYLNEIFIGNDLTRIPISVSDSFKIKIFKQNNNSTASITFESIITNSNIKS